MTLENIDSSIDKLNEKIREIESRPTEVYSRIVGYYRSVKNWNNGKSAEYKVRKTFMEPEIVPCQPPVLNVKEEEPRREAVEEMMAVDSVVPVKSRETEDQADLFALESEKEISPKSESGTYSFFFRNTCPNCPPMKDYLGGLNWEGNHINVDEEEGLNAAVQYNVFTAPTVILFDAEGNEIFRTDNVKGLSRFVESGAEAVTAV